MMQQVVDKIKADHPNNTVEVLTKINVVTNENDLQCIFVQTDRMKNWYQQYSEVLLSQFFVNVQLLIYTFHVLKYVKLKIHKLQVELRKREALMEAFSKVLYSRDESTMVK